MALPSSCAARVDTASAARRGGSIGAPRRGGSIGSIGAPAELSTCPVIRASGRVAPSSTPRRGRTDRLAGRPQLAMSAAAPTGRICCTATTGVAVAAHAHLLGVAFDHLFASAGAASTSLAPAGSARIPSELTRCFDGTAGLAHSAAPVPTTRSGACLRDCLRFCACRLTLARIGVYCLARQRGRGGSGRVLALRLAMVLPRSGCRLGLTLRVPSCAAITM